MTAAPTFRLKVTGAYWQLWARTVTGIDLSQHCMKSLLGANAPRLGAGLPLNSWQYRTFPALPAPALAYYVCGVSPKNELARNFHLLLVPDEAGYVERSWSWGEVQVSGARAIDITAAAIDPRHPRADSLKYSTCRNWQAAWMLGREHNLIKPEEVRPSLF